VTNSIKMNVQTFVNLSTVEEELCKHTSLWLNYDFINYN